MNRYASLALLGAASASLIVACDKNGRQNITAPVMANAAFVKFFNFGVGTPGVDFYANDQKVTALSSVNCQPPNDTTTVCRTTGNDSTRGTTYTAAGNGGLYNQVTPGQYTLSAKISAANVSSHLAIANVSTSLATGTYYSYYVSGIYNSTAKQSDAFVVVDSIPATVDYTQAYVRLVNAISNSQPMTLYANATAIGGNVAYTSAGAFTALPAGLYDLRICSACATSNVATRTAVSFVGGHVYTVTARGDMTSTATATKPALDNTANR